MECDTHASHRLTAYMHLLKASSIYSLSGFDMTRFSQNFRHVHHQSCGVMKYHFSGTFILPTFDMVEQKYVTAEASGDMYAEPSARKPGHQSANNCTVRGYRNISCFHQQLTLTCT
ncbi:hypothetical protein IGI04_022796 [Brassica rapa subsp. trilocularis]|uniref:Uncharacterized protein n=1 Tax=Brassica rapa subsp. trilocularis TaxID=1813537 RepID=A0ABQ7M466_BRACM|nr:hypothetical protein IGI04_022796 [Brassica rapa subsp. trilocularis]